jgi:putative ABC transport system permease protein
VESLHRHVRSSLRQIRRRPAFAAAVVATLALPIGANSAIFSFVNALLLRPFPFRDPGQLVEIHSVRGGQQGKLSMREILDIQEQVTVLDGIAAHTGGAGGYNFSGDGKPAEWRAVLTTGDLFEVLGAPLHVGARWPETADRQRDFRVVLTDRVWRGAFAGRGDVVGRKIALDHAPGYEIHGVARAGFDFPRGIEVYRSIGGFTDYERRERRNVVGIARVKRPHPVARLQAELDGVGRRLAELHPDTNAGLSFRAVSFRDLYSGDARPYLLVLLGAVGFVLLIGCANVANLMLSRALGREREVAVRLALGAGRSTLVGQFLVESVVIAGLAAGVGLLLAWWWMRLLRGAIGFELPGWMTIDLDGGVLAFTVVVSVLAGVLSGLLPAVQFARGRLGEALAQGGRGGSAGKAAGRLRDAMIVAEVTLAVVLLAGAGLLIQGFLRLQSQDKGFQADGIATFRVALGWKRYIDQASTARYYERALEQLGAVPGFDAVAFVSHPPLTRQEQSEPATVQAEHQSAQDALGNPYVNRQSVSEGYFALARIPLKAGRAFDAFDGPASEPVAIVSERLARVLWPGEDPIGRRLRYDPFARQPGPFRKVVGVAGSVQQAMLGGEPSLDVYVSYRQSAAPNQYVLVKTGLAPREFQERAERAMLAIDPEQSVFDFQTWDSRILDGIWQLRLSRLLLVAFGVVALALAAVGIYGVMSYLVGQRTREMGIRLALGATPGDVRAMVLRRGAWLGAAGLTLGLVLAGVLGRILAGVLNGIGSVDPVSLGASTALLFGAVLAASALPAWRASRVDPVVTLGQE